MLRGGNHGAEQRRGDMCIVVDLTTFMVNE